MEIVRLIHLLPALASLGAGAWLLLSTKGTGAHRIVGRLFAGLMVFVALSSFAMTGGRLAVLHGLIPIHLVSLFTLVMVPLGIHAARHGRISLHRFAMASLYLVLCVTGTLAIVMKFRLLDTWLVQP